MQFYLEKEGIFVVEEQRGDIALLDSGKQLIDILDMEHPLIALSDSIDWESIQQDLSEGPIHSRQADLTNPFV